MSIQEFLKWLVASGGAVIGASWILERIPWFTSKPANFKEWFFFGVVSVIWVLAYIVTTYVSPAILEALSPYFLGISGLFIAIVVGKMFHKADKIG